jgi:hypothetical protein
MIGWHNPEVAFDPKYLPMVVDPLRYVGSTA